MTTEVLFIGSAIVLGTASGAVIIAAMLYTAYCVLIPHFERRQALVAPPPTDVAATGTCPDLIGRSPSS